MENKHPIGDLMETTMSKIREMVDVNTIVGQPIHTDGVTIIPISKVSFGFASGGSDFATKNQPAGKDNAFGGGSGAGVNIIPVGFLIIRGDGVKMLPVAQPPANTADRVIELVPDLVEKVSAMIPKKDKKAESSEDTDQN
jgi:sporulation protein YtfJ